MALFIYRTQGAKPQCCIFGELHIQLQFMYAKKQQQNRVEWSGYTFRLWDNIPLLDNSIDRALLSHDAWVARLQCCCILSEIGIMACLHVGLHIESSNSRTITVGDGVAIPTTPNLSTSWIFGLQQQLGGFPFQDSEAEGHTNSMFVSRKNFR